MDQSALLQAAPLVQGRLNDQRKEICNGYVEWAVCSEDCSPEFKVEEIIQILDDETDITFEEIQVVSGLESLVERDLVIHKEGYTYQRDGNLELNKTDNLMEGCWSELRQLLNDHGRDIDTHFIDTGMEVAFKNFLNQYAEKLEEDTEIADSEKEDIIYTADVTSIIEHVVGNSNLNHPDVFKECLADYLQKPGEKLKEFVGTIYVAIVNTDLLSREEEINLPNMTEEEKILFFDSNVLQEILCESNSAHPLIRKSVERSRALGFDLYYYPETVDDFQRSIDGAIREMSGLKKSNYSSATFENQFLKDWNSRYREYREDAMDWSDYKAYIQRWPIEVEGKYSIEEYSEDIDCPKEEVEFAKDLIDEIDSKRHKEPKKPAVLNHDGKILAKTVSLREKLDERHNIGPLLLTLDNSVTRASDFAYQEGEWPEGVAIPPRVWFNYLLTFTSTEFDELEVGEIIIDVSANIDSQPSIEEYAKALEVKAGLESNSSELLARYLKSSTYSDEIQNSLRKDDGNVDDWAFKALKDSEAMNKFVEHKEQKVRIKNMGKKIQELEEENEELRGQNDEGDTNNFLIGGEANAVSGAQASAVATSEAELEQELASFMDLYFETVPGEIQSEISPPPEDVSNLHEYYTWLQTALTTLQTAEETYTGLSAVTRYGQRLLSELQGFIQ